ncbi:hypothetical protein AVEN_254589-1 [Araneus ventricosus]|uniref:Uncharacterized protein n=1 Tax=Araneus ventricosus TaxID=182803 RepID=A0A4Y2GBI6_ARAVE|nr:hypothetical protein AVEN_254589-1 [Araneus ventricosus]
MFGVKDSVFSFMLALFAENIIPTIGNRLSPIRWDPHYPPTQRISDFLPSKRGANLVKSFDVPPSLALGLKWESAHEALEFDFVGIPSVRIICSKFHRF